jgi:Flp pilus assembly protein TadG
MRRLRDESGATTVIVAVLLFVLVGMAAFVVDIGDVMWERRMLQSSADAAALAVAIDCAQGDCGSQPEYQLTASSYAEQNNWRGAEVVSITGPNGAPTVTVEGREVTVTVATQGTDDRPGVLRQWFSGVLGRNEGLSTQASATAIWGAVAVTDAELPLTVSVCDWEDTFGPWDPSGDYDVPSLDDVKKDVANGDLGQIIQFHDVTAKDEPEGCAAQPGHDADGDDKLPAGWGWLDADEESLDGCAIKSIPATEKGEGYFWADKDPGNNVPKDVAVCIANAYKAGAPVVIPVFVDFRDKKLNPDGNKDQYLLYAPAAFYLTGYAFPGNEEGMTKKQCVESTNGGSDTCIRGHWVRKVDAGKVPTGEIELGVNTVQLRD